LSTSSPLREALRALLRGADRRQAGRLLTAALAAEMSSHGAENVTDRLALEIGEALADVNSVSVIVTGLGWLGGGVRAIENAVIGLVEDAQRELSIAAYALTPGPDRFWGALERAVDSGIRCTMVVDRLEEQHATMREWVHRLAARHRTNVQIGDFRGEDDNDHLHAKVVVADRRRAIVGSANLTAHGLVLAHELALMVEGPAADEIAGRVDLLVRSGLVSTPS
jgi:cardiolipin synthase